VVRRGSIAIFATLLLGSSLAACGGSSASSSTAPAATAAPPPTIDYSQLRPCGAIPEPPGFRCGSIEVPVERTDPSYGKTRVAFAVRRRDQARRPSLGTIFAQEGGPGYASTGTANAYLKLFGDLLERRDLVLVDMRGTGLSDPYDCGTVQRGLGPELVTLSECAAKLGDSFISYRTQNGVDDLEEVRRALGLDRIYLYGDSYGTYFAQSYAFRHPDGLRALVLDSAYPARGESPWYGSLIRTGDTALALACRRSPKCSGDASARLDRLVALLRATRRGVGPLLEAFGEATYGTPGSYLAIDHAGHELLKGNERPWRRLTRPIKPGWGDPREYARAGELAVGCNDYPMIWDKAASESERRAQLEEAIAKHADDFGPFTPREIAISSSFGYLECLTWPAPTAVYEPPIPAGAKPTSAPVLVISGEMDNLTTPQEGRWVADEFEDSRQFIARNAGHVDALYDANGDAAREIRRFLRRH
jgi:pimeloyl-ACP methyl ester carboxylesterase